MGSARTCPTAPRGAPVVTAAVPTSQERIRKTFRVGGGKCPGYPGPVVPAMVPAASNRQHLVTSRSTPLAAGRDFVLHCESEEDGRDQPSERAANLPNGSEPPPCGPAAGGNPARDRGERNGGRRPARSGASDPSGQRSQFG